MPTNSSPLSGGGQDEGKHRMSQPKNLIRSTQFGDTPNHQDKLSLLVLNGKKTASCSAFNPDLSYPDVGEIFIVQDSKSEDVCKIKITKTQIIPFNEVNEGQAVKEGEGDLSLDYWRKEHLRFFKTEGTYKENMLLFFEEFIVID